MIYCCCHFILLLFVKLMIENIFAIDPVTTEWRCVSHKQGSIWAGHETVHMDFKVILCII